MRSAFVDTSAWFAATNSTSARHPAVVAELKAHRGRLVSSNFVVHETVTLIRRRLGWQAARDFGERARAGRIARMVDITSADEQAAWDIFVRYHDHVFSFTDCTSFALMQRLGLTTAITLDADFRTFGLHCLP